MKHIMLCTERLSSKSNAAFIELGGVSFDISTGEIFNTLNIVIHPAFWDKHGQDIDGVFVARWMATDNDRGKIYAELDEGKLDVYDPYLALRPHIEQNLDLKMCIEFALYTLYDWIKWHVRRTGDTEYPIIQDGDLTIWACDSFLDIIAVQSAYEQLSMTPPWKETMVRHANTLLGGLYESSALCREYISPLEKCRRAIPELSKVHNTLNVF